jgi:hypothetical protein
MQDVNRAWAPVRSTAAVLARRHTICSSGAHLLAPACTTIGPQAPDVGRAATHTARLADHWAHVCAPDVRHAHHACIDNQGTSPKAEEAETSQQSPGAL